jgi:cysteinyl-tRNA synthetase
LDDSRSKSRTEADENKRNPQDFVLWFTKSKFENQALTWDSPWGRGYPGWHIECSAMSIKYLGEQFDIHAGGIDHVAIHHTNEIAQSEAATGKHPWVRYWVHNEFLLTNKDKMSKSAGTFLTLQALVDKGYDPLDYRYFLLGGHYRSQLQFSWEALEGAKSARKSLRDRFRAVAAKVPAIRGAAGKAAKPEGAVGEEFSDAPEANDKASGKAADYTAAFMQAMEDDLSSPRALAELWGLLKDNEVSPADALAAVLDMDSVLGLNLEAEIQDAGAGEAGEDPALVREIEALIAERGAAKKARDFAKADTIRTALKERGIAVEDGPAGTVWRRI